MPFYLTPNVFKQQTKTLVKHWPFAGVTTAHVRNVLSQLYGYKNNHHYQQSTRQDSASLVPCSQATVTQHYTLWVQRLAKLAPMNEIQAKKLVRQIWLGYLQHIDTTKKLYECEITFRGDCAIFLDAEWHDKPIRYAFDDKPSIKDTIEALGVPHPEALAIQVNHQFVDFSHKLSDGEQITVFSTPDYLALPTDIINLPYKPSGKPTFLLDVHLGGLTRYLRMAGFDCVFENQDYGDELLAEMAHREDWILLTRDINLLKRSKVKYARWIRNFLPELQFHEVVKHYQLYDQFQPFELCIKCNGHINPVETDLVVDKLPKGITEKINDFKQCEQCQQVYWQGSHYEKIRNILSRAQQLGGQLC